MATTPCRREQEITYVNPAIIRDNFAQKTLCVIMLQMLNMCLGKSGMGTYNTNSTIIRENKPLKDLSVLPHMDHNRTKCVHACTGYKRIRLFPKLQGNMCLIMKAKIYPTPKL